MKKYTIDEATRLGTTQPTLSRLVRRGIIKRVGRGYYIHRYSKLPPEHWEFAMACHKFGYRAVIGGPSALYFHGLLSKPPKKVWVLVRYNQKTTSASYRCLRANRKPMTAVVDKHYFRVTNLERTLAECLKHAEKIGREVTHRAVRRAFSKGITTEWKVIRMAIGLGIGRTVGKQLNHMGNGGN